MTQIDFRRAKPGSFDGTLESIAAKVGITAWLRRRIAEGEKTCLEKAVSKKDARLKGSQLREAVEAGDELALRALARSAKAVGLAMANVFNVFCARPLRARRAAWRWTSAPRISRTSGSGRTRSRSPRSSGSCGSSRPPWATTRASSGPRCTRGIALWHNRPRMGCTGCSLGTSTNPGGNYVGVRLADAMDGKTALVFTGEIAVKPGERIIVEAENGPEFAEVTTTTPVLAKACSSKKAKRFLRLASDSEYADYVERVELQDAARLFADEAVLELKLDLHVVKCAVGFDRRRMTVLYTSEKKPETRELARRIADRFEIRVEMKSIGVRDETKLIGGIGSCGLTLCCSTWLKSFHPVAIKMAKMQGLTPNPSKLTGQCGRLKCCVAYELEGGIEAARRMSHGGRPAPPPRPAALRPARRLRAFRGLAFPARSRNRLPLKPVPSSMGPPRGVLDMASVKKPPTPAEPSADADGPAELGPRKLIRPSLARVLRDQGVPSRGPSVAKNGSPGADERRGLLLPQADAEQDADRRPPRGRRGAARLDRVVRQGRHQAEPRARPEPPHPEALHQVPLQGRGGAHAQEEIPPSRDALLRGTLGSGLTRTSPGMLLTGRARLRG